MTAILNLQIGQYYKTVGGLLVMIYARLGESSPIYLGYCPQAMNHLEFNCYGRETSDHAFNLMNPPMHEEDQQPETNTYTLDRQLQRSLVEISILESKNGTIGTENTIPLGLGAKQSLIIAIRDSTIDVTVVRSNTAIGKAARMLQYKDRDYTNEVQK